MMVRSRRGLRHMSISEHEHMPEPVRRMEVFTGCRPASNVVAYGEVVCRRRAPRGGRDLCGVARRHGLTPQQLLARRSVVLSCSIARVRRAWAYPKLSYARSSSHVFVIKIAV